MNSTMEVDNKRHRDGHKSLDQQATPKRYFTALDGIRGIAALFVAVRHTKPFFGSWDFHESYLAVDIFFVLSGVVIANAYQGRLLGGQCTFRQFVWLRLVRLYPLYLLGALLGIAAFCTGYGIKDGISNIPLTVLLALVMLPSIDRSAPYLYPFNLPSWSLFFELVANVAYALFVRFLTPRRLLALVLASAVGLAVCLYLRGDHRLDFGYNQKSAAGGLFRVGYSFFGGILLCHIFSSKPRALLGDRWVPLALFGILGAVVAILTAAPSAAWQPWFDFLTVIVLFPLIVCLAMRIEPRGWLDKICRFLGLTSYAFYVLHMPLGGLTQAAWLKVFGTPVSNHAPWIGLVFLGLLLALCGLVDRFYDSPFRRLLQRKSTG